MSGDAMIAVIAALGALALVASGLARRRIPGRRWLVMMLLWAAIIGMVWAAVSLGTHQR